jgi:diguanylate cyclase (GGDEF)-like protein
MFNSKSIQLGVSTVFFFSVINVVCKIIALEGFNSLLFTSLALFFAGFFLMGFGGANYNSVKILKSPSTWVYGFTSVSTIAIFISLVSYVSSTEAVMLMRLWIIVGLIIALVFYNRKTILKGLLGIPFILFGILYIFFSVDKEKLSTVIFLTILICVIQSIQYFALESQKKYTKTKSNDLSVMGYTLLSTSLAFMLAMFVMSLVSQYSSYIPVSIPSLDEIFNIKLFFLAPVVGVFGFAMLRTMEFKTIKTIGADIFMLFTALNPFFTLSVEYVVSKFTNLITPMEITPEFIVSNIFVVVGSFICAYGQVRNKKTKPLAPKAKNQLIVLRDTIQTAMVCFNDDEDKVAEKLGVGKRTIKQIMTTEKEVSKNIRHKIIFNHAQNVAGLDHLTGALNKSSFEAKLKDLENTEKALVLFIDLDKFKPVNDTYGHKAGDSILEGVAERLIAEFNHPHVVARLGGDEFCLIVYGKDKKDEEKLVKKVEKLVTESFIVEGINDEISVGCSIGSAHYPTEGNDGLQLNKIADERMYEAKLANGISR